MNSNNGVRLVRFSDETTEFEGFSELMKVGQSVRLVQNRDYVITEQQCELLHARNIKYKILEHL